MTMTYDEFLQSKIILHMPCGMEVEEHTIHPVLYPFQRALTRWALERGRAALFANTGMGKCHGIDTRILMYDGSIKNVQDIRVNDELMGDDGKPRTVLSLANGYDELYSVTLKNGDEYTCNFSHMLSLRASYARNEYERGDVVDIALHNFLQLSSTRQHQWKHYKVAIDFPPQDIPMDAYLFGAWIGDGHQGSLTWTINDNDAEIVEKIYDFAKEHNLSVSTIPGDGCTGYRVIRIIRGRHLHCEEFYFVQSGGKDGKRIDQRYLINSRDVRLNVLAGLLDTDGYLTGKCYEIATKWIELRDDILFLCRSLGFAVSHREKWTSGVCYYRIFISGETSNIPCLTRKKAETRKQIKNPLNYGFDIKPIGKGQYYGFTLDGNGRYLLADFTVTHNTIMQLEWARHVPGDVLIFAPLGVTRQTITEAWEKLCLQVQYVRHPSERVARVCITNYDMMEHFCGVDFNGIILDESSILKSITSKMRGMLIEHFAHIPYRLCCTATPAPNDIAEIANHAEFLGIMKRTDMLATFFVHDDEGWRLRGHAKESFYRWMASWAMALTSPEDIGFDGSSFVLPPLHVHQQFLTWDKAKLLADGEGQLGIAGTQKLHGITDRLSVRKQTSSIRAERAAHIAMEADGQVVIWVGLLGEGDDVMALFPEGMAREIRGNHSRQQKEDDLIDFVQGKYKILVTKVKIAGYGINMQNAHTQIFMGLSDSWEQYFQAVRRLWRYGQKHPVDVHVVLSEHERPIWENVQQKEHEALRMTTGLIAAMKTYEQEELRAHQTGVTMLPIREEQTESYRMFHGDSVEAVKKIADNSVHLTVYSPPFLSMYQYNPTERDMGNCSSTEDFFTHHGFLADELMRITVPGRNVCMHVSQVPAMQVRDGWIGMKDFRGDMVRHMVEHGWIYHGEVVISKNPQVQAIRVRAKGLAFTNIKKDSAWLRPALADYILVFRKPGENPIPVISDIDNETWIKWANPVWYGIHDDPNGGIRETDTLNAAEARENDDDRHICPLQLSVIERCVRLWSNLGETVYDPFSGIASTGYVAIQHGRKYIGSELKGSYFETGLKNLRRAETQQTQITLF